MLFFPKTEGEKQQIKETGYNTKKNRFMLPEFKHRQVLTGIGLLQVPLKKFSSFYNFLYT